MIARAPSGTCESKFDYLLFYFPILIQNPYYCDEIYLTQPYKVFWARSRAGGEVYVLRGAMIALHLYDLEGSLISYSKDSP